MRIAIVGAGALGLYYGAMLQRSGEEVHFLLRRDYAAICRDGLRVYSVAGDFTLPRVQGHRSPGEIGAVDLVLVGLKTFANGRFRELIGPLLGPATQILTLQNGLGNEEALAELFGPERVLGGVAFLCSNRGEPGEVHHLGAGRIVLGEFASRDPARVHELAGAFARAGVECQVSDDLRRSRWEKLVWNIPFNGLCALLQQGVERLLTNGEGRRLVRALMLEVIAAANAQGLSAPIAGGFADTMLEFTDRMGEYQPSMQIDRAAGRPLELGAIFAIPLARGETAGVPMPRVAMLATLLGQATAATGGDGAG